MATSRLLVVLMLLTGTLSGCATPDGAEPSPPRAGTSPQGPTVTSPPWYDTSWQYRKKITVNCEQVSGSAPLVNFPLLLSRVDPDWRSLEHGGHVGNRDRTDIVFTAADGTTKLDHEIENYVSTTGALTAWVRLPSLSPVVNTAIYIYYGNATAADQQNRTGVWESTYRGVWHLGDATLAMNRVVDSTANENHGFPAGPLQQYTGRIGGSSDFTEAQIDYGNRSSLQLAGAMTLSAWVNPRTYPEAGQIIGTQGNDGARGWTIRLDSYGGINFNVARDANTVANLYSSELPPNTWSLVTAVYEPGTAMRIYINGVLDAERTSDVPVSQYNNSNNVLMGKRAGCLPCEIDSRLDEVRVSAVARHADWILSEYHNQSSPLAFYAVSQQQGRE